MLELNGPGGATNATPGPTIGSLSQETAHMADISQYSDSALCRNPEQNGVGA
jgi:hypothetical protein